MNPKGGVHGEKSSGPCPDDERGGSFQPGHQPGQAAGKAGRGVAAGLKLASIVMYNVNPAAVTEAAKLPREEVPLFIMQLGYVQ